MYTALNNCIFQPVIEFALPNEKKFLLKSSMSATFLPIFKKLVRLTVSTYAVEELRTVIISHHSSKYKTHMLTSQLIFLIELPHPILLICHPFAICSKHFLSSKFVGKSNITCYLHNIKLMNNY